ncbi:unnamed protein product [Agarophyton chilense]
MDALATAILQQLTDKELNIAPNNADESPPLRTTTAGQLRLTTNKCHRIIIPSLINKDINGDLLSVHTLTSLIGPIIFMENTAFLFTNTCPIKLTGTATWKRNS